MKPHIRKQAGLYYCRAIGTITGIGYTPNDAYADWCVTRDWVFAV